MQSSLESSSERGGKKSSAVCATKGIVHQHPYSTALRNMYEHHRKLADRSHILAPVQLVVSSQIRTPSSKETFMIFHEAAASSAGASDGAAACLISFMSSFMHNCPTVNTRATSHALAPRLHLCIRTGCLKARSNQNGRACAPGTVARNCCWTRHANRILQVLILKPHLKPASPV